MRRLVVPTLKIFRLLNAAMGVLALGLAALFFAAPLYGHVITAALQGAKPEDLANLGPLRLLVYSGDLERLLVLGSVPVLGWAAAFFVAARIWGLVADGGFARVPRLMLVNFVLSLAVPLFSAFSGLNAYAVELLKSVPGSALAYEFVAIVSPDPRFTLDNLLRPSFFGNGALVVAVTIILATRWRERAVGVPVTR